MRLTLHNELSAVDEDGKAWRWLCFSFTPAIIDRCSNVYIPAEAANYWRRAPWDDLPSEGDKA